MHPLLVAALDEAAPLAECRERTEPLSDALLERASILLERLMQIRR